MVPRRTQLKWAKSIQKAGNRADARSRALAGLYKDGAEEIRKMLTQPSFFKQGRARVLIEGVDDTLKELGKGTRTWVVKNIPEVYEHSSLMCVDAIRAQGVKGPINTSFSLIHQDAVEAVAGSIVDDLTVARATMRKNIHKWIRNTQQSVIENVEIKREIAKGIIEGATRRDVTKRIGDKLLEGMGQIPESKMAEVMADAEKYMKKFGVKNAADLKEFSIAANDAWIEIGGRHFNVEQYASLVARTQTRDAVTLGTYNRLRDNGIDLVCIGGGVYLDICEEFRGRVFSVSGEHERYPSVAEIPNGGPPFHPNCEDVAAPFVERLRTEQERNAAADIDRDYLGMKTAEAQKLYTERHPKKAA